MTFDWKKFFDTLLELTGGVLMCIWCGWLVVGTFFFDRMPWWAVILHVAAALLTGAAAAAFHPKEIA